MEYVFNSVESKLRSAMSRVVRERFAGDFCIATQSLYGLHATLNSVLLHRSKVWCSLVENHKGVFFTIFLSDWVLIMVQRWVWCVFYALFPVIGEAATYSNHINTSEWQARSSVMECRLEHSVPFFGKAVFRTRAGERSGFFLNTKSARFKAGNAHLNTRLPVWFNPSEQQRDVLLGKVPVKQGNWPLWLDSTWAERLLAELNDGRELSIFQQHWFDPPAQYPSELSISNVGFKQAYRTYLGCLAELLPANFDQLKRTALYFQAGVGDELSHKEMRKLDNILALVKHDDSLRRFYIDGHASSEGGRTDNFELSKSRAELVADYLKRRGMPEDWLVIRWHGERYPARSNASAGGRSLNRRVTVRIERLEQEDVLQLGGGSGTGGTEAVNDGARAHAGTARQ